MGLQSHVAAAVSAAVFLFISGLIILAEAFSTEVIITVTIAAFSATGSSVVSVASNRYVHSPLIVFVGGAIGAALIALGFGLIVSTDPKLLGLVFGSGLFGAIMTATRRETLMKE